MKNSEKFWLTIGGIILIIFCIMLWQVLLLFIGIAVLGAILVVFFGGFWFGLFYPWYEFEEGEEIFKLSPLYWICVGIIKFNMCLDNKK
jgi:hypothetical protein